MTGNKLYGKRGLAWVLLLTLIVGTTACRKTDDSTTRWRIENEAAFRAYENRKDYSKIQVDGSNGFVYMKWLHKGDGKNYPIATSRVYVHYQTYELAGSGQLLDNNYSSEKPTLLYLHRGQKASVEGFSIGLQNMVEGDETEIIVPWYLAYKEIGDRNKGISGYTALRFVVKLDSIVPEEDND
ncbi:MAG: FKBP-type peptidyl-prolyl cis-trans isomerase [Porphyromonas sp.]|nr:FKBP-type peptidyl-prolyl cis-trans isomerase [Porphyromonas sp.]